MATVVGGDGTGLRRRGGAALPADEQFLQVTRAGLAEVIRDHQVGIGGTLPNQVRILVEDLSSSLLLVLTVLALWRFAEAFSGSAISPGTAAPLNWCTGRASTFPRASGGDASTASIVPFTAPLVNGQPCGLPRGMRHKTGAGRLLAR